MLTGTVYVTYSAYYVSINSSHLRNIAATFINTLQIIIFAIVLRNSLSVLQQLKFHFDIIRNNGVLQLQECLKTKISMIKKFIAIATAYFLFEISFHGLYPVMKHHQGFNPYSIILH